MGVLFGSYLFLGSSATLCPTGVGGFTTFGANVVVLGDKKKTTDISPFERMNESTPSVDGPMCSTESSPMQDERSMLPKIV
jgi:hypothetical protein